MPKSEYAVYLSDRSVTEKSTRHHEATMRWLREGGMSIKAIAGVFGKSYEWTRRIVKDLAYDYVNDAVEAA